MEENSYDAGSANHRPNQVPPKIISVKKLTKYSNTYYLQIVYEYNGSTEYRLKYLLSGPL